MTKPESQQELAVPPGYTGYKRYSVVNTCGQTQVPGPHGGWLNKYGYSSGYPRPANLGGWNAWHDPPHLRKGRQENEPAAAWVTE